MPTTPDARSLDSGACRPRPTSATAARRARALLVACLTPLAGCFSYVPVGTALGAAGATVRVRLDPASTGVGSPLASVIGPRAEVLEGRLVSQDNAEVTIAVETVTRLGGGEENWTRDPVRVPRPAVVALERRRLDPVRSALLAGVVVGGAVIVGQVGGGSGSGGRIIGGPTNPR